MTIESSMLCVSHNKNMRKYVDGKQLRVSFGKWIDTLPMKLRREIVIVSLKDFNSENIDQLKQDATEWRPKWMRKAKWTYWWEAFCYSSSSLSFTSSPYSIELNGPAPLLIVILRSAGFSLPLHDARQLPLHDTYIHATILLEYCIGIYGTLWDNVVVFMDNNKAFFCSQGQGCAYLKLGV